jgi:hypothetical protein
VAAVLQRHHQRQKTRTLFTVSYPCDTFTSVALHDCLKNRKSLIAPAFLSPNRMADLVADRAVAVAVLAVADSVDNKVAVDLGAVSAVELQAVSAVELQVAVGSAVELQAVSAVGLPVAVGSAALVDLAVS